MAIGLALSLAACGGDGDDGGGGESSSGSDGGSSTVSALFIKEADAICASAQKRVEGEFRAYLEKKNIKEPKTEAQAAEVIETIGIPALNQQLDSLRALGASGEGESQVNAYFDAIEAGIKEGEKDPPTLFTSAEEVFAEADKIADEIGFKVCGQR